MTQDSAPETEPATRPHINWDLVTVLLLSVTAVLTAWCGFESSKWGGEMSIAFSEASSARIQASNAESAARDAQQYDLAIYIEWARATQEGDTELAAYVEERFTPELRTAFDAWQADGMDETGPFATDAYVPAGTERAAELSARADTRFQDALTNNQRGDNYSLLTVLFALVLFFGAMSQRASAAWVRRAFLVMGIVIGIAGVAILLTFPVKV